MGASLESGAYLESEVQRAGAGTQNEAGSGSHQTKGRAGWGTRTEGRGLTSMGSGQAEENQRLG